MITAPRTGDSARGAASGEMRNTRLVWSWTDHLACRPPLHNKKRCALSCAFFLIFVFFSRATKKAAQSFLDLTMDAGTHCDLDPFVIVNETLACTANGGHIFETVVNMDGVAAIDLEFCCKDKDTYKGSCYDTNVDVQVAGLQHAWVATGRAKFIEDAILRPSTMATNMKLGSLTIHLNETFKDPRTRGLMGVMIRVHDPECKVAHVHVSNLWASDEMRRQILTRPVCMVPFLETITRELSVPTGHKSIRINQAIYEKMPTKFVAFCVFEDGEPVVASFKYTLDWSGGQACGCQVHAYATNKRMHGVAAHDQVGYIPVPTSQMNRVQGIATLRLILEFAEERPDTDRRVVFVFFRQNTLVKEINLNEHNSLCTTMGLRYAT